MRHFLFRDARRAFKRKRTGATTWDEARSYAAALEAAGSWDGKIAPALPQPDLAAPPQRITVADAINAYLANRQTANLAPRAFASTECSLAKCKPSRTPAAM